MTTTDDEPADRLEAVLNGWLPVTALDDRSLAADYPKALRRLMKENSLNPGMRRLYDDLAQELYQRADEKLRASLLEAVDTMIEIFQDMSVEPGTRLKAATYVFERMRGKTPDVVEVKHDKPFQIVLERIVAGERRQPEPKTIEGEVVESEQDEVLAEERQFIRSWRPETKDE
jgi:hypothetical protein